MANEADEGRDTPPLYRGGKNVAQPPKKPLDPAPEGGPKTIHSEEEDDEEDKPKRLKDVYKKTRLAGDVISLEQGKKNVEDAKKAQTKKTLQRALEIDPKDK
jgi:hypothetical protein